MKMKGCSESMLSRYGVNSKLQISRNVTALRFLPKYTDRPAFCHNVMKLTRKMFNFAVEKDILEHTPFAEVKVPVELSSRERVLTDAEITKLWATELPKNPDIASAKESPVRTAVFQNSSKKQFCTKRGMP